MKKIYTFIFALCFWTISFSQIDPCSINAGSPIDICNTDLSFQLNGSVGTNVDLASLVWTTDTPSLFDIVDDNDLNSTVNVLSNPATVGCYTFTLSGMCSDGTVLSPTVQVCVQPEATIANITVDGVSESAVTICHSVVLNGNDMLQSGETGCWYYYFQDQYITVSGENCVSNDLTVGLGDFYFDDCKEYTFFYEISNGGCTSTDEITVAFIGQDESVSIEYPVDGSSFCTNTLFIQGSSIGCLSSAADFGLTLLNPGDFTIQPTSNGPGYNLYATFETFTFYESGWYTFEYNVDPSGPCTGGTDIASYYICLLDTSYTAPPNIFEFYCDGIPSSYTFQNTIEPGWIYDNWVINTDGATPTVTVNGDFVTISGIDPATTELTATQSVIVDQCIDEDLEGNPITFDCGFTRYVYLREGADIELETENLEFLCGAYYDFVPWDFADYSGYGTHTLEVLSAPDPDLDGRIYSATSTSLNLIEFGKYVFELKITFNDNGNICEDSAILCVLICDAGQPAAPEVSPFCVGETVQLAGTVPDDTCANILWTQVSGPGITFTNGTDENDINPFITVDDPGTVCIEYSYSQDADCYLADTTCFQVNPCDSLECLTVTILDVFCKNQGTEDPDDDYWYFNIQVDDISGNGVYWTTSGDISENGSYGEVKTIWPSGNIMDNPTYTFTVFDAINPECYVTVTVNAPPPCSIKCDLDVELVISECNDNGTPGNVSDDFFEITLTVSGTGGQAWMVKQKYDDGTENLVHQDMDDQTVTLTFLSQDGDFTLWIFLSDYFDCLIDIYVDAPETCSGCLDVVVNNKQCYDNGTAVPDDDYWTFDIEVNGGSGYWTAGAPINDSGSYGSVKTIWVGTIDGPISFIITDSENPECQVKVTVEPPKPCSIECKLEVTDLTTKCKDLEGTLVYYVSLHVEVADGQCFMVKRKNADGSEEILGTYNGPQDLTYGPFGAGEEFTLWVMLCETFDCVRDFYVQAPEDCENCIDYSISNLTCYDNGTSDPSDDYWTFDIIAFGPGSYWTAGYPINDSGSYGSVKTIWVGGIEDHPAVEFTIYDNEDERCYANVYIEAPKSCSKECKLEVKAKVTDCKEIKKELFYYVHLDVQIGDDECFMVKKKNGDGSEEVLGTYNGSQQILLGPFAAGEDFTLWIMGCETFDCVRDIYIKAPDCEKGGERNFGTDVEVTENVQLSPNPVRSILNVVSSSKDDTSFDVYNMDGLVISTGKLVNGAGRMNVSNLKEGIYLINIPRENGNHLVKRFIVLK